MPMIKFVYTINKKGFKCKKKNIPRSLKDPPGILLQILIKAPNQI